MDEVYSAIMSRGAIPTRADIAALLSSIAAPGRKQKTKQNTVRRLFDELGVGGTNFQGMHVADALEMYEEY